MENLDFSEEEIQEQLKILGYTNVPKHRLREFKRDLDELIQRGEWRSLTSPTQVNSKSQTATTQPSPPAFTKEKVRRCYFKSDEGFFLHTGQEDNDRQVLTTCQNRDFALQQPHCDSYAQHSVAPKLQLPAGAPNRLQVEPETDDSLHPPLSDSYTSTPDSHERRFIKRKVLRKHKGQSLVCDESIYSEDSDHTPQHVATMYKMYDTQWEDESDDDRNSLNSSFWSDGERKEEEEEEVVEIERVIGKENSKPDDSQQEASKEEKPERDNKADTSEGGGGDDDDEEGDEEEEDEDKEEEEQEEKVEDDEEGEDEEEQEGEDGEGEEEEEEEAGKVEEKEEEEEEGSCSSSSGSPAPSLMTSGYGTYRPEEQEEPEGGDFRDDHTITEFDQDSRADLSEARDADEEDDRSLCSFGEFNVEPSETNYSESRPPSVLADTEVKGHEAFWGSGKVEVEPNDDEDQTHEKKHEDLYVPSASEEQRHTDEEQNVFDGWSVEAGKQNEEEEEQDLKEENLVDEDAEDKADSEDQDESSSNKDIKFIDSKVDFNWAMYKKMCEEFEGNLRQKKDAASCLEERLAELHLSTSAQHDDFETENEDVTGHSDAQSSDGVSMSAFESYIRGMTRNQSDGDIRPKPKSFIRPVMSQPAMKKTDPVAKYFHYKQLWEMFKLPGETDRRSLRWEIKERLAYQPPPPKPRRVYVPNTYVVPTEKKRSALRWEIRNDLANGLLPHKFNYRF